MPNNKLRGIIVLSGLSALGDLAYASQPPDAVSSDGNSNTAMGTNALINLSAPPPSCTGYFACSEGDTAAGLNALAANTTGSFNDAFGSNALAHNTTGYFNGALGASSLVYNTTGHSNTASGTNSLFSNTTGYYNVANGTYALMRNTTGYADTAVGTGSLYKNTTGYRNTALGAWSLYNNTTGVDNTALGHYSMGTNTTGSYNTAAGTDSLFSNTTGQNNTAFGQSALFNNTTGRGNAAQGVNALISNTTGIRNVGIGNNSLHNNVSGSNNIGIGQNAGYNVITGSNNIEIGAQGTSSDDGTIQIGTQGTQMSTTVAGIFGVPVIGSAVFVTSTGQLGVQASSEHYKIDIAPMTGLTDKLEKLRPVTFHYKTDPDKVRQYGLIAEEVAKVYPELVIRDRSGKIQGVHYEELAPILLDEVQKQRRELEDLKRQFAAIIRVSRGAQ